jgi:predicted transcriptional regulator
MKNQSFIGRTTELQKLEDLHKQPSPGLVVIKGRRRIGKSRLVREFANRAVKGRFWSFAGLAPEEGLTAQHQRDNFARQMSSFLKTPPFTFQDWTDAFEHLSLHLKQGDIVLLDEISWMGNKDPSFIPKLKAWWDKQTLPIIGVFCGSVSTWIEENILKSTAFFGRVNLTISLEPLSITESAALLRARGFQSSPYDMFKLIGIMGGIPWYLEQVKPGITADEIIKQLCFDKDGLLVHEFERIFYDLFNGKGENYKKILRELQDGMKTLAEIRTSLNFPHSGTISQLMENLITAGFVQKQQLWSFKTTAPSRQSLYRINDPYTRFYLKLIEAQKAKIEKSAFNDISITSLPGFDSHMGLQLEYLLLQNRPLILKAMGISAVDVVCDGPYRQSKTSIQQGCQIDYLVQTATKNLFVCEFKFKRSELGSEIIESMKKKINALKVPRGYAAVPVLFHIGGVAPSVETDGYFYRIIDISNFLRLYYS